MKPKSQKPSTCAPEAGLYRARAEAGAELLAHANAERQGVTSADDLLPHELPTEEGEAAAPGQQVTKPRHRPIAAGITSIQRCYSASRVACFLPKGGHSCGTRSSRIAAPSSRGEGKNGDEALVPRR